MMEDNKELVNRNMGHLQQQEIEMQEAMDLSRIYSILYNEPVDPPASEQDKKVAKAVHAIMHKYDKDGDGELNKQEATPFIKSFNHFTIGLSLEMTHDPSIINERFQNFCT